MTFLKKKNEVQKQSPEVFCKKCVLKNFANFNGKHVLESFFDKVSSLQPAGFLEDSNTSQGRRKLFYGGGGGGLSKKKKKEALAKTP